MTPPLDILGTMRDRNRAGSAMCAKLSFSFEKMEGMT
jgi:hypothetical protein